MWILRIYNTSWLRDFTREQIFLPTKFTWHVMRDWYTTEEKKWIAVPSYLLFYLVIYLSIYLPAYLAMNCDLWLTLRQCNLHHAFLSRNIHIPSSKYAINYNVEILHNKCYINNLWLITSADEVRGYVYVSASICLSMSVNKISQSYELPYIFKRLW